MVWYIHMFAVTLQLKKLNRFLFSLQSFSSKCHLCVLNLAINFVPVVFLFPFWLSVACCLQVTITPEVSSRTVNRAIMAELVRLYKESDLGTRLPAYDGRKSLYTAGELPFAWKEFKIKLVDQEDGINGPK